MSIKDNDDDEGSDTEVTKILPIVIYFALLKKYMKACKRFGKKQCFKNECSPLSTRNENLLMKSSY